MKRHKGKSNNKTLRVLELHTETTHLIEKLKNEDSRAQKIFYQKYAPKILSICRQYISDTQFAEDVMLQVFLKIFQNIRKFDEKGHFEGWIRRITVNACISHIRSKKTFFYHEDDMTFESPVHQSDAIYVEDIQKCIDQLPEGCKIVFVMYAIDGYKHQEISDILNISVGTSKSQLAYARKILQSLLKQYNYVQHG